MFVPGLLILGLQLPGFIHDLLKSWIGEVDSWPRTWALVAFALSIFASFFVRERLARKINDEDRRLVDSAFGEQFSVEIVIVANGRWLGADRGVAWFADGLMGFSGASASFVLAACDIESSLFRVKGPPRPPMPPNALYLSGASVRNSYIVVHALGGTQPAFRERLRLFEFTEDSFDGERFWPPLRPYQRIKERRS